MSRFAEQTCEDKYNLYMGYIAEWQALQNTLNAATIDDDTALMLNTHIMLEVVREDIDQMYKWQDSRCTLPTLKQALVQLKLPKIERRRNDS